MAHIYNWIPKCLHWPFCPGVFIAILAFVAAAVTFRKEPGKREKAFLLLVFFALMLMEIWMLGIDRRASEQQQADDRRKQVESFGHIADGLTTAITGLNVAIAASEEARKNTQPHANIYLQRLEPIPILRMNVYFINIGAETADHVRMDLQGYVGKLDDVETQKRIAREFDSHWAKNKARELQNLQSNEARLVTFDTSLTQEQKNQLLDRNSGLTLYVLIRWVYRDSTGTWANDQCVAYQDMDTMTFALTHPCKTHNDHRYRFGADK